jgi:hypothetical protein
MPPDPLDAWHALVRQPDRARLGDLLAPDATFHSPIVHTPQRGAELTARYLGAALEVLGNPSFQYLREFRSAHGAVLEFSVELDGVLVNGVDMIEWNDAGRITDFKVMIRPLKAIQRVHERMAAALGAPPPASP